MRQEVDMTAVVRALPGTPNLITGESVRLPNNAFQEQVSASLTTCCWFAPGLARWFAVAGGAACGAIFMLL
jgi:hypothetical protein